MGGDRAPGTSRLSEHRGPRASVLLGRMSAWVLVLSGYYWGRSAFCGGLGWTGECTIIRDSDDPHATQRPHSFGTSRPRSGGTVSKCYGL